MLQKQVERDSEDGFQKHNKQSESEQRGAEWNKAVSRDEKLCLESVFVLSIVV